MLSYRNTCMIVVLGFLLSACSYHYKAEKFEVYYDKMKPLSSHEPIRVVVPQNAEKNYLVENINTITGSGIKNYFDLNQLYGLENELIVDALKHNHVPVSINASKQLFFKINKIQWERWGGGFGPEGIYLYFTLETSSGYRCDYKVQDQSMVGLDRAVGGTLSRAVEAIFQDPQVISFITD